MLLRARERSDVPVLQELLNDDVRTRVRADSRPWRPMARDGAGSPYAVAEASDEAALFSVVETATGLLAVEALLWAVDAHNRGAHLGMALLPHFRGRGLSHEILDILRDYAFGSLGLNRLQIERSATTKRCFGPQPALASCKKVSVDRRRGSTALSVTRRSLGSSPGSEPRHVHRNPD